MTWSFVLQLAVLMMFAALLVVFVMSSWFDGRSKLEVRRTTEMKERSAHERRQ